MNEFIREKDEIDISFIVPCLNEENNVIGAINNVLAAVKEFNYTFEILIIDDNSIDNTVKVVEDYSCQYPDVPIILKKNKVTLGLGRNYVDGAFMGRGKYCKLVAGSNTETKEGMVALLKEIGKADIVTNYIIDTRSFSRKITSKLYTSLVSFISGYSLKYYNGSAVLLRNDVMRWHSNNNGNGFISEFLVTLLNQGKTYKEIPVKIIDHKSHVSKAISLRNFLSVSQSLLNIFFKNIQKKLFKV